MLLISDALRQYKANLHAHSTISDGKLTPTELKRAYRDAGYSVLAITDHECPADHTALSEKDFLMLTGYEAYVRPNPIYDIYQPEIHLNFFARDPHNTTLICFDPRFAKYRKEIDSWACPRAGREIPREYSREYIAQYIRTARENGYIVAYNHPVWSFESEADILTCDGCFSFEIFNSGSYLLNGIEYNGSLYDRMLRAGKRIFCHAADDNHNVRPFGDPECDSFHGYTMILAPELTYDAVFSALEQGSFYASRGPRIHRLSIDGRHVSVDCDPVSHIHAYTGSKAPKRAYAETGKAITHAEFDLDDRAMYFRLSAFDEKGRSADTRAYFPDELGW